MNPKEDSTLFWSVADLLRGNFKKSEYDKVILTSNVIRPLACLSFLIVILNSEMVLADTLRGRVVSIADGDTVTVLDASNTQWKIRLMGIDAPEKKMPFGQRSKENLSDLVLNKQVAVYYSKQDRYGRTVGKISINGIDANFLQISTGMAWHYKQYQMEQTPEERVSYAEAEVQAREGRKGLWIDVEPTPPWVWRKDKGKRLEKNGLE